MNLACITALCGVMLCACHPQPEYHYLQINDGGEYGPELALVASFLKDTEQREPLRLRLVPDEVPDPWTAGICIDFYASWEDDASPGGILISKTWLVPREDPLAGRTNTSRAACHDGGETIIPITELEPPFIALRVEGLSLGDEGYPLVRVVGIRVRETAGSEYIRSSQGKKGEKAYARLQAKIQALEAALQDYLNPQVQYAPCLLWIAAAGDLMMDQGASELLFNEGPLSVFGGTAELLAKADLTLVNLEGVVSSRGTKVKKSFNFRFEPKLVEALGNAGIDAVLLANNHAFDYGPVGFLDSLDHLEKAGIGVLGAGLNEAAAAAPFVFSQGNHKVRAFGLASFPREKNGWDGLTVAATQDNAGLLHAGKSGGERLKPHFSQDPASLDVVLFHGGEEWSRRPDTATRTLYTDLVQQGADLVIGSHPHVIQGFEWVLGKPVFWSLGNYVFGGIGNTDGGEEGLFIMLGFWGNRLVYLEPYPLSMSHTRTEIGAPEGLNRFYTLSQELRTQKPF
ncbi:MAG: CapA family protein [Treponema sp.]|jgi:poly-gamma-glutamate synthesis protein (capsule biosynthesis protein)|nr:CapA family protein [Treponema sp.]